MDEQLMSWATSRPEVTADSSSSSSCQHILTVHCLNRITCCRTGSEGGRARFTSGGTDATASWLEWEPTP